MVRRFVLRAGPILLGLTLVGGCGAELAQEGEGCSTSAECAAGLLCDIAQDPSVCVKTSGPRPDLAGVDQAAVQSDLAPRD